MTTSVVMTLAAPLQAWGGPAVTTALRPTDSVPTLSGVTGLIANALGRGRNEPLEDLQAEMHVRIDRPGMRIRDFHTVGTGTKGRHGDGVPVAKSLDLANRSKGKIFPSENPITGDRWYLSDAAFTVFWTPVTSATTAETVAAALERPARPLYLGRRSCPPGYPVLLGITDLPAEDVFSRVPLLRDPPEPRDPSEFREVGSYFDDVASAAEQTTSSDTVDRVQQQLNFDDDASAAENADTSTALGDDTDTLDDDTDTVDDDADNTRLLISVQWQVNSPETGASARNDVPVTFDPAARWHYHHSRWTRIESVDMSEVGCAGRGRRAHLALREALSQINATKTVSHTS